MKLSEKDVASVSMLARLRLTNAELRTMTHQLGQIVHYVEQLAELNTDGVEPMAHAIEVGNVFASDEIRPSLPRSLALSNAPKADDECYRVPAVLGD